MSIREGAAFRRFLRFFFSTWKEIAPPALKIFGENRKNTKYHKSNLKSENIEIYLKIYLKIEKS